MKRSTPLARTGFSRPQMERKPRVLYKLTRPCAAAVISTTAVPVPKADPVRSEVYRRIVASLPCILCGVEGFSQAAHGSEGKGMALKACDLMEFPLCCDRPGCRGCHSLLDQGALFAKATRRDMEREWATRTVRYIFGAGLAPAGLVMPDWAQA